MSRPRTRREVWRCPIDGTPITFLSNPNPPADAVCVEREDTRYCSPRCRKAASRGRRDHVAARPVSRSF